MNRGKFYKSWADLVDLGFEFSLANLSARYGKKRALKEMKASLLRQSEVHRQRIVKIFKALK